MRTGSTWLHEYLLSRNDVCLPKGVKETFYFGPNYSKGEEWYRSYFRHFDPIRHRSVIEVCPTLFASSEAIPRVRKVLHAPTLMATLRDPVERAWSNYMHLRQHGEIMMGFEAAVRKFPSLAIPGLYAKHLAEWIDEFGREKVHVVLYDDLKERQPEFVLKVNEVFGLPHVPLKTLPSKDTNAGRLPYNPLLAKIIHRAKSKLHDHGLHWVVNAGKRVGLSRVIRGRVGHGPTRARMTPDIHSYLVEQFSPDVEKLEKLLNIDLEPWRRNWARLRE